MEDKKYQVVFCGETLPGADVESVKENLAKAFKVDKNRIESLFSGGKKVVKKDASREVSEKTKKIFESAGALVSVIPQGTSEEPPSSTEIEPEEAGPGPKPVPEPEAVPVAPAVETLPPSSRTAAKKPFSGKVPAGNVSKTALLLLTFFLGGFGVHKFYLARNIQGILYLLFCWTGIPGLIAMVEFFIYVFTSQEKLNSRYKTGSTPLVIITAVFGPIFFMALAGIIAAIAIPLIIVSQQGNSAPPVKKSVARPPAMAVKTVAAPRQQENSATILESSESAVVTRRVVSQDTLYFSESSEEHNCSGKIKGLDFTVEQALIQNGVLHLRQGKSADREIIVFMLLEDKDVSSQRIAASADRESFSDPHIHLRWKTGADETLRSDVVIKGYDLDLEFGEVTGQTVRGKIDFKIPDNRDTFLAGTFTAEVMDK